MSAHIYLFKSSVLFFIYSEESIARAKYHLALTIRSMSDSLSERRAGEADRLAKEAHEVREKYIKINGRAVVEGSELQTHDSMVSLWAGRMGILATPPEKEGIVSFSPP